jgi:hypothetical protein
MSLQSVDPNIRHHIIMSYLVATPLFVNPVKCFMFGELVTKPVVQNWVVPLGTSMNHTSAHVLTLRLHRLTRTDPHTPTSDCTDLPFDCTDRHCDHGLQGLTYHDPRTARTEVFFAESSMALEFTFVNSRCLYVCIFVLCTGCFGFVMRYSLAK